MNAVGRGAFGQRVPIDLACPDCASELLVTRLGHGLHKATILHDDTCPWLRAYEAANDKRNQT